MSGNPRPLRSQVASLTRLIPCSPDRQAYAESLPAYRDALVRTHFPLADLEKRSASRFENVSASVDLYGVSVSAHARTAMRMRFSEENSCTLALCLAGSVRLAIDGRRYELTAGSEAHMGFEAGGVVEVGIGAGCLVTFQPAALDEAIQSINASQEQRLPSEEMAIGPRVLAAMGHQQAISSAVRLAFVAGEGRGFMSEAAAADLVLRAIGMMMIDALGLPDVEISGRDGSRAASRARAFMLDRMGEDITLTQLEQAAGVSRRSLQMHFRRVYGMTPMQYLREQRLLAARAMLSSGRQERITDVALACGFVHMSGFSALFRERFGLPPGEFARRGRV